MKDFFNFRTMISIYVLRVLYILGAVFLTIFGLVTIFSSVGDLIGFGGGRVLAGLGIIILGNVIWRVASEIYMVLFGIHKMMLGIEENMKG